MLAQATSSIASQPSTPFPPTTLLPPSMTSDTYGESMYFPMHFSIWMAAYRAKSICSLLSGLFYVSLVSIFMILAVCLLIVLNTDSIFEFIYQ